MQTKVIISTVKLVQGSYFVTKISSPFRLEILDKIMKRFPKSIRKYIRKEKARIRRQVFDAAEQKKQIADLIAKLKMQYNKDKS